MKILVINGSPAGEGSITLQTVLFIQKYFPDHEYRILHAAQRIRAIEKDFGETREALSGADLLLFSYPVYTFLAPSQLHRLIALIKENGVDLRGKYAAQITTSKHFYDMTAHRYVRENCDDLGLRYLGGLSADMEDLLKAKGQKEALMFFRHLLWQVRAGISEPPAALSGEGTALYPAEALEQPVPKKEGKQVVVVSDLTEDQTALASMIGRFTAACPYPVKHVNLRDFPFKGGCLGCFRCASSGKCIYQDGFDRFLREEIQTGDAIVYAYSVRDHSMGTLFKMYDDRQFCNGHRTVTMGKPVGYLVDGALSKEPNLRTLMEARASVGGNPLSGIVSNESDPEPGIDRLSLELSYTLRHHYTQPADFYGVGGLKIFRDLIYQMQGLMKEDHRFYKKHGFYDFPQKRKGTILGMYLVGAMMGNPKLQKKIGSEMTKGMLMPYRKVIEKARGRVPGDKEN